MVLVNKGSADIIIARETYEDLISLDRIPDRLQKGVYASVQKMKPFFTMKNMKKGEVHLSFYCSSCGFKFLF